MPIKIPGIVDAEDAIGNPGRHRTRLLSFSDSRSGLRPVGNDTQVTGGKSNSEPTALPGDSQMRAKSVPPCDEKIAQAKLLYDLGVTPIGEILELLGMSVGQFRRFRETHGWPLRASRLRAEKAARSCEHRQRSRATRAGSSRGSKTPSSRNSPAPKRRSPNMRQRLSRRAHARSQASSKRSPN